MIKSARPLNLRAGIVGAEANFFAVAGKGTAAVCVYHCIMSRTRDSILDLLEPLRRYAFALTRGRAGADPLLATSVALSDTLY